MRYRGRFAPSPTGPPHFGSLVAALGSYLDARHYGGEWLVRIEDLDRPREVPGAADDILRTLELFGLHWDGAPEYQSRRDPAYADAAQRLESMGLLFPCACSRREIRAAGRSGPEGPIYHGACRNGVAAGRQARSLRIRTPLHAMELSDRIQGRVHQDLQADVGDFVLRRTDGLYAYQLAVVVDDAWQGITHVVRGGDLLLSTPRQVYLQECLSLPRPEYAHLPLALDDNGQKLSKQYGARPVDPTRPAVALYAALQHLGQELPPERPERPREILGWATAHWKMARVPARPHVTFELT